MVSIRYLITFCRHIFIYGKPMGASGITMAKVTAVVASPRKGGNCNAIVDKMAETLRARGDTVEVFRLNELDLKGCQACMGCKKAGKCVRKDDLTPVLESMASSDSLILATPDYFGQPASQYRTFEDRLYGFVGIGPDGFVCNLPAGKKAAVVVTSGSGAGAEEIIAGIKRVLNGFLGVETVGEINYKEAPSGPAKDNADAMAEAVALAGKL